MRFDTKPAAIRHRIAGIDPKVEQRELEFGGIDCHRPKIFRDFNRYLDILPQIDGAGVFAVR